ncbi:Eco57I restriction-modification methylase domain-containing protein [Gulosibacter chungangensis]|uniref:Eco57I restriction-modification methylase domain-containing protein n=1 Tax=Gulosibacter chungangensis TaxID=979746 RepID=UPI001CE3C010|nr:DNA methyltransferase [Gulosibacter chungangensis]
MASDAMIIGESWISEHFFTTDSKKESFNAEVQKRHRLWKDFEDTGQTSARSRLRTARGDLVAALSELATRTADGEQWLPSEHTAQALDELLYTPLTTALGAGEGFLTERRDGPVRWFHEDGIATSELAIIEAAPADSIDDLLRKGQDETQHALVTPYVPEDDELHPLNGVPRLLSRVFQVDEVPYALVFAGQWVLITDRERWPEGRYLAIDLQIVLERNDQKQLGEMDRTTACLAFESFVSNGVDNSGTPWWTEVIDASKKHAVGVSQDLRDGVRESIEIIANEVVSRRKQQGLPPLPQDQAQPLAVQSLRYLYRILFLLYAEASPELEVLPVGSPEYGEGYSIDRLRDLALVELESEKAKASTHLYESLDVLFRLVDQGHGEDARQPAAGEEHLVEGLTFHSLRADLFAPAAIAHISDVKLGNQALIEVLSRLLLSRAENGRDRGFISYADLGINQLGAVYEGLMSYTGFFAEEDLYEVAKNGDSSKGSWVVPTSRADHLDDRDFVMEQDAITGAERKVVHRAGTFVYRLSGRARQQSASYYTPEVLTKFTVSQALEELLDQNDTVTPADEILELTVCEPALGSGAFAIEATRQLAAEYLKRKQRETGITIDPEEYPQELQRVKAHIALHQVYGVDLNSTAVELAEISLWLDTMLQGLDAPWFGLHLRRGNSLIGARHAVYSADQIKRRAWLKTEPAEIPTTTTVEDLADFTFATQISGKIFHFLLPAAGWGAAADNREVKELSPTGAKALRDWSRRITVQLDKRQIERLQNLSLRVERMWQFVIRRFEIAEREARRSVQVFGQVDVSSREHVVKREEIQRKLQDADGAYQRLRLVMDAWCALWFWPVPIAERDAMPPDMNEWMDALQAILGVHTETKASSAKFGQTELDMPTKWDALGDSESNDLAFANVSSIADVIRDHPWISVVKNVADAQGFFHWSLDFASVMAKNGGFDLQVGNPPWVRPRTDLEALYAEADPWWQLNPKATQAVKAIKRREALSIVGMPELVMDGASEVLSTSAFIGSASEYAQLTGLQPDYYRCFMVNTWRHSSSRGISSLLHPDTHFTDARGGAFRASTYPRIRRHWQFVNELQLFREILHLVSFGVHVYGAPRDPYFLHAVNLYHPDTVESSLVHDGSGAKPGIKDPSGNWDLRPHRSRIEYVNHRVLKSWRDFLGDRNIPVSETSMVYIINTNMQSVVEKLVDQARLLDQNFEWSAGWHETIDRRNGRFDVEWGLASSWSDVILQGVHIHIANSFYKSPNKTMKHHQDWTPIDLSILADDALPVTSYKPNVNREYREKYTHWGAKSALDFYRFAWRNMASNTGERTLVGTIIPPGAAHINAVSAIGFTAEESMGQLLLVAGVMSSLVADAQIRLVPKSTITAKTISRLAIPKFGTLEADVQWRMGRLVSLTNEFESIHTFNSVACEWALTPWWADAKKLQDVPVGEWDRSVPLRIDAERRQALVEIDVIVALCCGLTVDDLSTIYRTQFPVLVGHDKTKYVYDLYGREIPGELAREWHRRGNDIEEEELLVPNTEGNLTQYVLPFRTLDREAEMREAYAYFEKKLQESA